MKVNFHCAHWHRFFPLGKAPPLTSVFFNSLYDPFGSPCRGQKRCSKPFHSMDGGPSEAVSKINPSFFTIKEGSTAFPKPLSPQGTGDVPTALLGAQTASLYGWRTIRGLRQQQSCGFLCGDEPTFTQGFAKCFCPFRACCLLATCRNCCLWERRDTMLLALTSNERRE